MKHTVYASLLFCGFIVFAGCSKKDDTPKPIPSADKVFTSFKFNVSANNALLQDIDGDVKGDTIYAPTFAGTNISALVPVFVFKGTKVTVDAVEQASGNSAHDFRTTVGYTITAEDGSQKKYIVKVIDTGLPTLYLSTNNVVVDSKDNYIDGAMYIAGSIAGDTLYNGKMEIRGRGNSTWGMPKKPYKIKLGKKASLLGMDSDKQWVLLANYADKTLMRNQVAFELSRRLGLAYTTAAKFVDVVLNKEYVGTYQLVQTIDVSPHKINIEEQYAATATLPGISGGYIVELDGFAAGEKAYFQTPRQMAVTVHYPDDKDINNAQKDYISGYFTMFEDALFSGDFTNATTGYKKYFDVPSYINYYLVNEIIGNPDIFWSTYMFKNKDDDKIYTGPVWDFDIAANNDERIGDAVNKLMLDAAHDPKQWINRLMEDEAFRHAVRNRWNAVMNDKVKDINSYVDQLASQLMYSQQANFKRWDILNEKVYLNLQVAGSYTGEVDYLKNYLQNRIAWLDGQFNGSRFD